MLKKKAPITASRGREDRWTTRQDDDSLQAHWAKHGPKYNHVCKVIVAEGGSDIPHVFESQPDDSKPFGIRCTVCSEAHKAGIIMSNGWTDYTYKGSMRQGVRQIQVEDLRRHYNKISRTQRQRKQNICKGHETALAYARAKHVATDEISPLLRRRPRSLETSTPHAQSRSRL